MNTTTAAGTNASVPVQDPIADKLEHNHGNALIKPAYDPALTNEDLAPLKKQTWSQYNIFAFWMADVHSVGGYITAGSLFALGLSSWQVSASCSFSAIW